MTTAAAVQAALTALLAKRNQDYFTEFQSYGTALQAWLDAVSGAVEGVNATSTANVTPGAGANVFSSLLPTTRTWDVGTVLRATSRADASKYVQGAVTASSAGSVTITGTLYAGAAAADWDIGVAIQTVPAPRAILTKTANYTVAAADRDKLIDCTSGTFTLTLLAASTALSGWGIGARNSGTGTITIDGNAAETIDGYATIALLPGQAVELICDGSNWKITSAGSYAVRQTVAIAASGWQSRTTNGPADGTGETTANKNNRATKDFDASTVEYMQAIVPLPNSFNAGTISYRVHWSHPSTTTNFKAAFSLAGVALTDDDALDAAFGTAAQVNDTGGTTDDLYITAESGAVTIAGTPTAGKLCQLQFSRVATDATNDTLAVDARVHMVEVFLTLIKSGNDAV